VSVGVDQYALTDQMIEEALVAQAKFIAELERIAGIEIQ
jgi:hypothetical protein